jgi:hypothetical protein
MCVKEVLRLEEELTTGTVQGQLVMVKVVGVVAVKVWLFMVKVVGDGQNVVKLDTTLVVVTGGMVVVELITGIDLV